MHFTWPLLQSSHVCARSRCGLAATSVDLLWVIVEDALAVSAEGDPAKPGDQRRLACSAFVVHLQHLQWAMRRGDGGPILVKVLLTLVRCLFASVLASDSCITRWTCHNRWTLKAIK